MGSRVHPIDKVIRVAIAGLCLFGCAEARPKRPGGPNPGLVIPRLDRAPTLEDFQEMKPSPAWEGKLAHVEDFTQIRPGNGTPSSQRTEAFMGYDQKNLYVIFICHDTDPKKIRARMVARETFIDSNGAGLDDIVSVTLDTYHDQRRGYMFQVNPFGIQWDALFSENGGFDVSFDMVWSSKGKLTPTGYVVWIALPFKSMRFSPAEKQTWGIELNRDIPRNNEAVYWPRYDTNTSGILNKAADISGMQNISPGRNIQFIPYGTFRSFRALDQRDPTAPRFASHDIEGGVGLDSKIVIKDSLVLDVTLNPDFSQVESDEPQVTANQRFEVFFPEKRPFFLENSTFFRTPINLLFTRRIGDPQYGARLTGKVGKTAIGALFVDDEGPGKSVTPSDPLAGTRAFFGVVRVSRDIFKQSSVGVIYSGREYKGSYNRVGGVDTQIRMGKNWTATGQAVASSTQDLNGNHSAGPAYNFNLNRSGRQFQYEFAFDDYSPGFVTDVGFVPRTDIRDFNQNMSYTFRPEGKTLVAWGPSLIQYASWDHAGNHLNGLNVYNLDFEFHGANFLGAFFAPEFETLRPQDFPVLTQNRMYHRWTSGVKVKSRYFKTVGFDAEYDWGRRVNTDPAAGKAPDLARRDSLNANVSMRPLKRLRIDSTYLFFRLVDPDGAGSIFNDHIVRTKWNWQFSREFSLRLILQYNALLANQTRTALTTTKNFNADILFTYLLHPGTAIYAGYNSNLQNIDVVPFGTGTQVVRTNRFANDAKGFFVKLSYLLRF